MNIAILTFQGFNEIDSLVAFRMLKWLDESDWTIQICCPDAEVISMGGLAIRAQGILEDANNADAVIIGSGIFTRDIIKNESIMNRICLNPNRQIIGAQCSGTLMLAKLGLLLNREGIKILPKILKDSLDIQMGYDWSFHHKREQRKIFYDKFIECLVSQQSIEIQEIDKFKFKDLN